MLQGLAIGIIVTTSIFAYNFYYTTSFTLKKEVPVEVAGDLSEEDIKDYLRSNDLLTVNKNDYEELLAKVENRAGKDESFEKKEMKKNNKNEITKEIRLTIKPGTASSLIGFELEGKGLIKDKTQFEKFLIKAGLETKIKAGEYKLSSDMSLEEIIDEIT